MVRLSEFRMLLAVSLGALGACRGPAPAPEPADPYSFVVREFADQTPDYVLPGALDSVVLLHDPVRKTIGSGTVIAPDRILTALHVIENVPRDDRGRLQLEVDGEPLRAVVESCGDVDGPHGDWAILAFERARWTRVAIVHPPACEEGWVPAIDQEVLMVGYAAGFFPDLRVDVESPTPSVVVRIFDTGVEHPCWYAVGEPLHLGGMSGGAVMVWNQAEERPELIGVFRGYVGAETRTVEHTRIHGVTVASKEVVVPRIAYTIHRLPYAVRRPRTALPLAAPDEAVPGSEPR